MTARGHSLADRARGALLGTALGDAVGAPFEGRRHVDPPAIERWLAADEQLTWTDDTAMAIGLARSLVARDGEVDPQHLGDTFAAAYAEEPWRGYGAGPPRIFAAAARGTPYVEAAVGLFDGTGSYGNGAAMRAAPVGVLAAGDVGRAARLAREQAAVTHAHPLATDGAALVAMCVTLAMAGGTPATSLDVLGDQLATNQMREALLVAAELAHEVDPTALVDRLGHGVAAITSVPTAVALAVGAPDDLETALVRAVAVGGDTDTIAAMAGAIVGARLGAAALPDQLLARLERRDELSQLAAALVALADR